MVTSLADSVKRRRHRLAARRRAVSCRPLSPNDRLQLYPLNKSGQVLITREGREGEGKSHFSPSLSFPLRQLCRSESCFVSQSFESSPPPPPPTTTTSSIQKTRPSSSRATGRGRQTKLLFPMQGRRDLFRFDCTESYAF